MVKYRRLTGLEVRMVEGRSAFKTVTCKPMGRRPLGRPRRKWEDNVRRY